MEVFQTWRSYSKQGKPSMHCVVLLLVLLLNEAHPAAQRKANLAFQACSRVVWYPAWHSRPVLSLKGICLAGINNFHTFPYGIYFRLQNEVTGIDRKAALLSSAVCPVMSVTLETLLACQVVPWRVFEMMGMKAQLEAWVGEACS